MCATCPNVQSSARGLPPEASYKAVNISSFVAFSSWARRECDLPFACINSKASTSKRRSKRMVRALSPVRRRLVMMALLGVGSFRRNSAIISRSSAFRVSKLSQINSVRRPRRASRRARRRSVASVIFTISVCPNLLANSRQKLSREDKARVSGRTPSVESLVVLAETNR